MELGNNQHIDMLPRNPPDQEPESIKQKRVVLDAVKQLKELSVEDKSILERMISHEDPRISEAIQKSASSDELGQKILSLIRSASPSPSPSPAAMDVSPDLPSSPTTPPVSSTLTKDLDLAMKKIGFQKPPTVKACLNFIQKNFQLLEKHPEESKSRKHRMDNLAFKKNVSDIPGAKELMEAVGYKSVTEKDKAGKELHYLEIEKGAINFGHLTEALAYLQRRLDGKADDYEKKKDAAKDAKKVLCGGGCGFWGDEATEGLCSVCHKKKYGLAPKQPDKPAAKAKECIKGCGFFGLDQYKGMCSSCFKKSGEKAIVPPKTRKAKWKSARLKLRAVRAFQMSAKRPQQKNKNRCFSCNKKIGTTETPGIECKCLYVFCPSHRMPNDHDCPFDFKSQQRKKLQKENKVVSHKKFDTIEES
jgi:cytochrome c5